ncbi:MAG: helix-turn-helix domain-containing protein [Protaetiibacter sp.]
MNKNTIIYRLRRIEVVAGIYLRDPRDLTRIVLALDAH